MAEFDFAIIGAGVVGCALARRLTLDGAKVVILEKAPDILDGASKGNSAILHTGFDAPVGSLEQKCVAAGYREYLEIHDALGLPVLRSGAMVLAWNDQQEAKLDQLIDQAHRNGVGDVRRLTKAEILAREPALSDSVKGGFLVPGEYLIDPWSSPHAYLMQALLNGAELRRNAEVLSGRFSGSDWTLETGAGGVSASHVITCAGLYGDVVDRRLTGREFFQMKPRKGQFVVFDKAASALTSTVILPVPTATTKGVVVCRTIFGNLIVGPTAEEQESRTDASTDRQQLQALVETGCGMLPALRDYDITACYAGIRPATEEKEYRVNHLPDRNFLSVGGIRSTGLSAALGLAGHVAGLLASDKKSPFAPLEAPVIPQANRLSNYHDRDWKDPGYGEIICHCELVTRREVERALEGPLGAKSLQGLKRQTRVAMGRCQGFNCLGRLAGMTEGHFDLPVGEASNG